MQLKPATTAQLTSRASSTPISACLVKLRLFYVPNPKPQNADQMHDLLDGALPQLCELSTPMTETVLIVKITKAYP